MNNRIEAIQKRLQNEGIDYLLISDPASINYLLGKMIHPGERMLVLCLSAKENHQFFLNRLFNNVFQLIFILPHSTILLCGYFKAC